MGFGAENHYHSQKPWSSTFCCMAFGESSPPVAAPSCSLTIPLLFFWIKIKPAH